MPLAKYCITCQSQEEKEMGLEKMGENDLPYREFSADGDEENNN
jgi:RNA polymerase-binding transcription factor DksA